MKKNIFIIGLLLLILIASIFVLQRTATRPKALVAFVIDDWGYNRDNIDMICELQRPLTISILPNLRYSKEIAESVRKNSRLCDIILHLPLESKSNRNAELGTIRCDMEKDKLLSILERDIESIPGIIGVSNHQGSKATEDEKVMRVILEELKKKNLFFLDSLTTANSVSSDIAYSIRLKYAQRDVFLDITDQADGQHFESYIKKQIRELVSIAKEKGRAIGVGHNIALTLRVIKEAIPEIEKQGIKIVHVGDLVR